MRRDRAPARDTLHAPPTRALALPHAARVHASSRPTFHPAAKNIVLYVSTRARPSLIPAVALINHDADAASKRMLKA